MIKYGIHPHSRMQTKTELLVSQDPGKTTVVVPPLKKEKESLKTIEPKEFTKLKHSIEAWKERTRSRKIQIVKHTTSINSYKSEDVTSRDLLPPPYVHPPPYPFFSEKEPEIPKTPKKPLKVSVVDPKKIRGTLRKLQKGKSLEELLENHGIRKGVDIPTLKNHLDEFMMNSEENVKEQVKPITKNLNSNKWQKQVEQLKDLKNGDNLEKWLESLDVPHNISAPHVKAKLKKYFMHETFENFQGRSIIYKEDSRAKKLWDQFKDMNPAKQVTVVVGITALTAILGFFTWELYLLVFPNVLAINPFFIEVGAQLFVQRQEGAFHLLIDQTERAKPLSTAWANQFILWKYI